MVSCSRMRDTGQKIKNMKFHVNPRKHFFYCAGGQTLEQVAQELWSLGEIQNITALVDPALNGVGLDYVISRSPFQSHPFSVSGKWITEKEEQKVTVNA